MAILHDLKLKLPVLATDKFLSGNVDYRKAILLRVSHSASIVSLYSGIFLGTGTKFNTWSGMLETDGWEYKEITEQEAVQLILSTSWH